MKMFWITLYFCFRSLSVPFSSLEPTDNNIPIIRSRSASFSISCPVPGTSTEQLQCNESTAVLPQKNQVFYYYRFPPKDFDPRDNILILHAMSANTMPLFIV